MLNQLKNVKHLKNFTLMTWWATKDKIFSTPAVTIHFSIHYKKEIFLCTIQFKLYTSSFFHPSINYFIYHSINISSIHLSTDSYIIPWKYLQSINYFILLSFYKFILLLFYPPIFFSSFYPFIADFHQSLQWV